MEIELPKIIIVDEKKKTNFTFEDYLKKEFKNSTASSFLSMGLLATRIFNPIVLGGALSAAAAIYYFQKMKESSVNIYTPQDCKKHNMIFPIGHPKNKTPYIQHPIKVNKYIPAGEYISDIFDEKLNEILRLLQGLGANKILIENVVDSKRNKEQDLGVNFSEELNVSAGFKNKKTNNTRAMVDYDLKGHDEPKIPADLTWYEHERIWQNIAEARINTGLEKATIRLSRINEELFTADFNASIEKYGVKLDHEAMESYLIGYDIFAEFGHKKV